MKFCSYMVKNVFFLSPCNAYFFEQSNLVFQTNLRQVSEYDQYNQNNDQKQNHFQISPLDVINYNF